MKKIGVAPLEPERGSAKRLHKSVYIRSLLAAVFILIFAACSDSSLFPSQQTAEGAPERFDYALSVDISADSSRAEIERRYGGHVVVWHPEAGFAVLGLQDAGELHTLGVQENKDAFKVPEFAASATYGNGRVSWAGGRTSWAGGRTSWAGGEPTTFVENLGYWDQIDLPEAQVLAPRLGAGVKVAVIDTGIDLIHPAFMGKLAPADEWKDFVDGDAYPQEEAGAIYGHGTGVADLILQVAPNVTLLPIRALGPDGLGDTVDVIAAIDYAVQRGANIINLSLGTDTEEKVLKDLIKYAWKQEALIFASVGNSGGENIMFPARYDKEVLGVGSVNAYDELSSFSSYGKELSLTAPGESLYTASPEHSVAFWSGTSFSTPLVAGAAALALGEGHPKVKPRDISKKLADASDDISRVGRNDLYKSDRLGKGRLDIEDFLEDVFK